MKSAWLSTTVIGAIALLAAAAPAPAAGLDELVAAAKAEGELTIIAVPRDWCGYGGVIDAFKAKYGLKVNELNPDAGSGDEIEAIKANKGNKGPQAPDVIDVGLSFGPSSKAEGLLQPYKVSTWSSIPGDPKDAARLLVRGLLRRARLRDERRHRQEGRRRTGRTSRSPTTRTWWWSPATRAPPTS